jgi:hypothetical protein
MDDIDGVKKLKGRISINNVLHQDIQYVLNGITSSRRMKRCPSKIADIFETTTTKSIETFGPNGEFYFDEYQMDDVRDDPTILDYNIPPGKQPSLYCEWVFVEKDNALKWSKELPMECPVSWLKYLIAEIFGPNGYILNGAVQWKTSDSPVRGGEITGRKNSGWIIVNANSVSIHKD